VGGEEYTDPEKIIVCKCERVNLKQIREAIASGLLDIELLKRALRIGMGPCQGTYCLIHVMREIARVKGCKLDELRLPSSRPPIAPIPMRFFASQCE